METCYEAHIKTNFPKVQPSNKLEYYPFYFMFMLGAIPEFAHWAKKTTTPGFDMSKLKTLRPRSGLFELMKPRNRHWITDCLRDGSVYSQFRMLLRELVCFRSAQTSTSLLNLHGFVGSFYCLLTDSDPRPNSGFGQLEVIQDTGLSRKCQIAMWSFFRSFSNFEDWA